MWLTGSATVSWGRAQSSGIAHCAPKDRVEVYGTKGTLVYDIAGERILMASLNDESLKELPLGDDEKREWAVELGFIQAVRGERDPEPSFEDGIAYMDVVEATARSCETGNGVPLPLSR